MSEEQKKGIPLFAPFYNHQAMEEHIESLADDMVTKGDIFLLLGMFEQTVINGFTEDKENEK